ncbi:MAG: hypothetical protein NTAFB05_32610 [Nitrobacter sp.]
MTHAGLLSCRLRPALIALNGFRQLVNLFAVNPAGGWPQGLQSGSDAGAICGVPELNSDLAGEQRDLMIGILNKRTQPRPIATTQTDFGKNSERAPTLTQMGIAFPFSAFTGLRRGRHQGRPSFGPEASQDRFCSQTKVVFLKRINEDRQRIHAEERPEPCQNSLKWTVAGKVREQLVDPRLTKTRDRARCGADDRVVAKPLNRVGNVAALSKEIAENGERLECRQRFDRTTPSLEESTRLAPCQNLSERWHSVGSKRQYLGHAAIAIVERGQVIQCALHTRIKSLVRITDG